MAMLYNRKSGLTDSGKNVGGPVLRRLTRQRLTAPDSDILMSSVANDQFFSLLTDAKLDRQQINAYGQQSKRNAKCANH